MRRAMMAALLAAVCGCGGGGLGGGDGGGGSGGTADMALNGDLSTSLPDMSRAAACMPAGGTMRAQYVWNSLLVPMQRSDYAMDLNGDGRVDNQFGNIVGALVGQALDPQGDATKAVMSGQSLTLVDEHADDLTTDDCAASDVEAATAMAAPDFSGSGHFTVDATATAGHFAGPIAASKFSSVPAPADAATPVIVTVPLPLFGGVTKIDLVGAHVSYTRGADGKITGGQLNGAIRNADVQSKIVPSWAAAMTAEVQANPSSSMSMQLLSIFDNGGKSDAACAAGTCKNPDNSCAVKGDNKIDTCELATSGLITNLLAPDVQMFDAGGNYHPSPDNTMKDSMSIGLGFSAVPATF